MLEEFLQDRSALYLSGALPAAERAEFEILLEGYPELREFHAVLADVGAALACGEPVRGAGPRPELRSRVLSAATGHRQEAPHGVVFSGADGLVQWVNPSFSEMCGYGLDELRGKKLGPILQGPATDPTTVARLRQAVRSFTPCREALLNYHKNGTPYWVEIEITPIRDPEGQPRWFVARERERPDLLAA